MRAQATAGARGRVGFAFTVGVSASMHIAWLEGANSLTFTENQLRNGNMGACRGTKCCKHTGRGAIGITCRMQDFLQELVAPRSWPIIQAAQQQRRVEKSCRLRQYRTMRFDAKAALDEFAHSLEALRSC